MPSSELRFIKQSQPVSVTPVRGLYLKEVLRVIQLSSLASKATKAVSPPLCYPFALTYLAPAMSSSYNHRQIELIFHAPTPILLAL